MNRSYVLNMLLFGTILVLDRISKSWALVHCSTPRSITRWCDCVLAQNSGVAWSIAESASPFIQRLLFGIIALLILLCIIALFRALRSHNASALALSMVTAGAVSNLYDRWVYGGVIDFIALHYGAYSWPIFNGADLSICIGGALWWFLEVYSPERSVC